MNIDINGVIPTFVDIEMIHCPGEIVQPDAPPKQLAVTIYVVIVRGWPPEIEPRSVHHHGLSVLFNRGNATLRPVKHDFRLPDDDIQIVSIPLILNSILFKTKVGNIWFLCRHRQLELLVGDHVIPESGILFLIRE